MQRETEQFVVTQVGEAVLVATGQSGRRCTAVSLRNLGPGDVIITGLRGEWTYQGRAQSFQVGQYLVVQAGTSAELFTRQEANDFGVIYGGTEFSRNEDERLMVLELALSSGPAELSFLLNSEDLTLGERMLVRAAH